MYDEKKVRDMVRGSDEIDRMREEVWRVFKILEGLLNKYEDFSNGEDVFNVVLGDGYCLKARYSSRRDRERVVVLFLRRDVGHLSSKKVLSITQVPMGLTQVLYKKLPAIVKQIARGNPRVREQIDLLIAFAPQQKD